MQRDVRFGVSGEYLLLRGFSRKNKDLPVNSSSSLSIICEKELVWKCRRRGGRVVEGARLESVYTVTPYRGFESLSLRH